jgi:hypothetical protein
MQVLVKNPFLSLNLDSLDLLPSFWNPECLYPGDEFSFTSLLDLSDSLKLSPLFFLDARVAFTLSAMASVPTFFHGLGPLGTVAGLSRVPSGHSTEEIAALQNYIDEYFPRPAVFTQAPYDQIVTFGETRVDEKLWDQLQVGGFYILGSIGQPIELPQRPFEAFGKLWPFGNPTEFGWAFNQEDLGLEDFYFSKFKKLG